MSIVHLSNEIPHRLATNIADLLHFLMRAISSVEGQFVFRLNGHLDMARFRKALRLSLDADPILGCRFVDHWYRPYWQRREDLDTTQLVKFHEVNSNAEDLASHPVLKEFMATPGDPCQALIQVLVLRGDCDLVCIKLSHTAGDGPSYMGYLYRLAEIYNEIALVETPSIKPNVGNRDASSIIRTLTTKQILHLLRRFRKGVVSSRFGSWIFPESADKDNRRYVIVREISSERVAAIWRLARRLRATPTMIYLAAFYLAARKKLATTSDDLIDIATTVDLRYKLPRNDRMATPVIANLASPSRFQLNPSSGVSLEEIVKDLNEQEKLHFKEGTMGLESPAILFSLPVLRIIPKILPFGIIKRKFSKRIMLKRTGNVGMIALANFGVIDPAMVRFGDLEILDVWLTPPIFKVTGLALGVTGLGSKAYLATGLTTAIMEESFATDMIDALIAELPT